MRAFVSIDGRSWDTLGWVKKLETAYLILDLHPRFRDEINKDNKPGNMHRDLGHFIHACAAEYLVTEDNGFLKKASTIVKALDMKVKVVKMESFMVNLSNA
jgi:hypothetical protein